MGDLFIYFLGTNMNKPEKKQKTENQNKYFLVLHPSSFLQFIFVGQEMAMDDILNVTWRIEGDCREEVLDTSLPLSQKSN